MAMNGKISRRGKVHRWTRCLTGGVNHALSDCGQVSFFIALLAVSRNDTRCKRCFESQNGVVK
jgi:hypothetical protein